MAVPHWKTFCLPVWPSIQICSAYRLDSDCIKLHWLRTSRRHFFCSLRLQRRQRWSEAHCYTDARCWWKAVQDEDDQGGLESLPKPILVIMLQWESISSSIKNSPMPHSNWMLMILLPACWRSSLYDSWNKEIMSAAGKDLCKLMNSTALKSGRRHLLVPEVHGTCEPVMKLLGLV